PFSARLADIELTDSMEVLIAIAAVCWRRRRGNLNRGWLPTSRRASLLLGQPATPVCLDACPAIPPDAAVDHGAAPMPRQPRLCSPRPWRCLRCGPRRV